MKVIDDFVTLAKNNENASGDADKAGKEATRMAECVLKAGADPQTVMDKMKAVMK